MVRLTDRPDMTLDVDHGRKTTTQHNTPLLLKRKELFIDVIWIKECKCILFIVFIPVTNRSKTNG